MALVLIIDDHPGVGEALSLMLSLHGIHSHVAMTPEDGVAALTRLPVDVVIQDMNFTADTTSGVEGQALFHRLRGLQPDLPIVLLTAWTHLDQAVSLVKAGAADYLAKPWDDAKLLATVQNLIELAEAQRSARQARVSRKARWERLRAKCELGDGVYESDAMLALLELAAQVTRSTLPVLVTGPNGSGKERIAALVHANSPVAKGPFVALNCGALPSDLVEAELFGAESGAYTGAARAREGRFDAANGGTLFLDEIGNLPLAGQAKLLRVLETGQFERLGSNRTRSVQVRLISATNADLVAMVAAGTFREDLFYRLNVLELRVPPLCERSDDILPLAERALAERASLTPAARAALVSYHWPGNVRELNNTVERAVLLSQGGIVDAADLRLPVSVSATKPRDLGEPSRAAIEAALAASNGVVARAAQALGLSRQSLYRRMAHAGVLTEAGNQAPDDFTERKPSL